MPQSSSGHLVSVADFIGILSSLPQVACACHGFPINLMSENENKRPSPQITECHMLFALAGITTKIQTGADVILRGEESGGRGGGGSRSNKLLMIGVIWANRPSLLCPKELANRGRLPLTWRGFACFHSAGK